MSKKFNYVKRPAVGKKYTVVVFDSSETSYKIAESRVEKIQFFEDYDDYKCTFIVGSKSVDLWSFNIFENKSDAYEWAEDRVKYAKQQEEFYKYMF